MTTDVMVWEGDLYAGTLPPVCVLTGEQADQSLKVRYTTTPRWVILLLLLGVVPAIVGWLVTRRTVRGSLPLSARGSATLKRRHRYALAGMVSPLPLTLGGGAVAGIFGSEVSARASTLLLLASVLLFIAAVVHYTPNGVRGHVDEPTPWGRWVQLQRVNPAFAFAVQRMYAERAAHMHGMPMPPPVAPHAPGIPSPWAIGTAPLS